MISRQKLLEAAARVFAEYGFRGATTRRIAEAAGVNEVTLFRLFGSKSALIAEALRAHAPGVPASCALPETPRRPLAELTRWSQAQMQHLRDNRSLITKTLAEMNEHPEMEPCMSEGRDCAYHELVSYARALRSTGATITEAEARAAASMMLSAIFADAMWRFVGSETVPQPEAQAPQLYSRLFLRALGCPIARQARRATPKGRGARPRAVRLGA